jgi:hypothetical protein
MALYPTNVVPLGGTALRALLTAASQVVNGDTCATGVGTFLLVENTGAGACVVTIATPGLVEGDLVVAGRASGSVPITNGLNIIPLTDVHRDPATGLATLTFSATSGVKAIVCRVP